MNSKQKIVQSLSAKQLKNVRNVFRKRNRDNKRSFNTILFCCPWRCFPTYSSNKMDFDFDPALLEVYIQICFYFKIGSAVWKLTLTQMFNGSDFSEFVKKEQYYMFLWLWLNLNYHDIAKN